MIPRTIRTDPLANWCMFEARDRYRITHGRIGESERLSEIGAKYRVNKEAVSEIVGEFQELGAVGRAKNSSAAVNVPRPEEIQEGDENSATLEENTGPGAAGALKGKTTA